MGLGGLVGDDRDARARRDERAGHEGVLAEHRGTDGEDEVVARERLAQARAVGRQLAGEGRVVLREAGARPEGLLPDGRAEALGEVDERRPRLGAVGARADDERRGTRLGDERRELLDRRRVGRA